MERRCKNKKVITFVCIFFSIALIIAYYLNIILPILKTYTAAETRSVTERAINLAVSNVINRTISYDALIDITYTANGEIASFSANQHEINTITREIVKETQFQMQTIGEDGVKINIGTFTGFPFLLGKGPIVNLRLVPIGVVGSNFESEFESVGINMTKHSLFLYIDVHISIVMPIKSYEFKTTNEVLLAESIIVGKVPEVYLNGLGVGKNLNLVP